MSIKLVSINALDTTGAKPGSNLIWIAANASFEWIQGTYVTPPTYSFQGSSFGYAFGGAYTYNSIHKIDFTADSPSSTSSTLINPSYSIAGAQSSIDAYAMGGELNSPTRYDIIQKTPFSSETNATDVGELTGTLAYTASQSSST